jgi:hypothetical protein
MRMLNRKLMSAGLIGLAVAGGLASVGSLAGCKGGERAGSADGRVERRGFLQSDQVAVGGETTGWVVVSNGGATRQEVDVSKVRESAERLRTRRVIVVGTMEDRTYPTRGVVPTLVASAIVWDEAQNNELNAGNLPPPPSPTRR